MVLYVIVDIDTLSNITSKLGIENWTSRPVLSLALDCHGLGNENRQAFILISYVPSD